LRVHEEIFIRFKTGGEEVVSVRVIEVRTGAGAGGVGFALGRRVGFFVARS
jgi:hypothetical protein